MNIIEKLPENEICKLYTDNKTLTEIRDIFNHKIKSVGPIKRILLKNNIILRKKGELRAKNKKQIDIEYFKCIDSHEKAYWLGMITADGHITKDNMKLVLALKDLDPIESFKKSLMCDYKVGIMDVFDKRTGKSYRRYSIQIGCKNFIKNIINLGVTNSKSYICDFPKIEEKYYNSYIRGLFDGDGSVCYVGSKLRISLIALENILEFIQNYLIENFKFSKTKFSIVAEKDNKKICKLYISKLDDMKKFLNFIYLDSETNTRLDRKYQYYLDNYFLNYKVGVT